MRLCWGMMIAGCWWGVMSVLVAAEPEDVPGYINQLGASDFSDRQAAHEKLRNLGQDAIPALEAAAKSHEDLEIRSRCASLLELAQRTRQGTKYLAAKKVQLNYNGMPLGLAVQDLAKLTDTNLKLDAKDSNRPVTVKTGELPVWEAVEAFRVAAKLTERFRQDPPASLENIDSMASMRRSYYSGPQEAPESANSVPVIWIDGESPSMSADLHSAIRVTAMPGRFPANRLIRGAGQATIHLDIALPNAILWQEASAVRIDRAEDDTGRPVTLAHPISTKAHYDPYQQVFFGGFGGYSMPTQSGNPRLVPVNLRTDDRHIRKLAILEGTIQGDLALPNQVILDIPDVAKVPGRSFPIHNDARFEIRSISKQANGNTQMTIFVEAQDSFRRGGRRWRGNNIWDEGGLGSGSLRQYRFTDATGKTLKCSTWGSTSSSNGITQSSELQIVFSDKTIPQRLEVLGTRTVTIEIPFRLKDVSMP
jgi:hypothetical protein